MKESFVDDINVSYINDLFAPNKPFEASTTKSSLQMRARRSPDLGSNPISINSHIKNRTFYWFITNWNLTVNNNTFNTINDIDVQIIANHINGKSISRNRFISSIGVNGTVQESFSPTTIGSNNMIMDSSNPNLNFQVNYFNGGSTADINFNWGSFTQNSGGQPVLITTTRTLSQWGTNGGVNVTVDIF